MSYIKNPLIGPHEGKELSLMIEKKKQIAYFPEMDPQEKFAKYVADGSICRYEWKDKTKYYSKKTLSSVQNIDELPTTIIYYLRGKEHMKNEFIAHLTKSFATSGEEQLSCEKNIGKLLGYSEEAISAFLKLRRQQLAQTNN
ncbi:MAG: hypothetical protein L3J21_12200 [Devosiaceae bacterium]|nr:hypothetical protein [Devosiaceae bacterium]